MLFVPVNATQRGKGDGDITSSNSVSVSKYPFILAIFGHLCSYIYSTVGYKFLLARILHSARRVRG